MNNKERKGKTFEEIYGKEKGMLLRRKLIGRLVWNKGKTYEEVYGKEKADKLKKEHSKKTKGITNIERHGIEKAKEISKKISIATKGRGLGKPSGNKGKLSPKRGKTLEEYCGKEKAKEIGRKISLIKKGKTKYNIEYINRIKKILKDAFIDNGPFFKKDTKKFTGYRTSLLRDKLGNLDNLAEELDIIWKKQIDSGRIGKNEKKLLDRLEIEKNIKLERQFTVRTNNKKLYFIDGYDITNNEVYSIYENFHENQKEKDFIRQKAIEEKLGCKFNIIKDGWG